MCIPVVHLLKLFFGEIMITRRAVAIFLIFTLMGQTSSAKMLECHRASNCSMLSPRLELSEASLRNSVGAAIDWENEIRAFVRDNTITILGGSGFVGKEVIRQILDAAGNNHFQQIRLLLREKSKNAVELIEWLRKRVSEEVFNSKIVVVWGDHVDYQAVSSVSTGETAVIDTSGLAWQHPPQGLNLSTDKRTRDRELLKIELLHNGLAPGIKAIATGGKITTVWVSTNAVDNMIARLRDADDRERLQTELQNRAKKYVTYLENLFTARGEEGNSFEKDMENAMKFISEDLEDNPPGEYPKYFDPGEADNPTITYGDVLSYNYSKAVGELVLQSLTEKKLANVRIAVISDVYGPGQPILGSATQKGGVRRGQVFADIALRIAESNVGGPTIDDLMGQHGLSRDSNGRITQMVWPDYVFPMDVALAAQAILRVLVFPRTTGPKNGRFKVGGESMANIEFVKLFQRFAGIEDEYDIIKTSGEIFERLNAGEHLPPLNITARNPEEGLKLWFSGEVVNSSI